MKQYEIGNQRNASMGWITLNRFIDALRMLLFIRHLIMCISIVPGAYILRTVLLLDIIGL